MDPLSQVIGLLRPRELSWRMIVVHEPWAIQFPAVDAVVFGQMIEGTCTLERGEVRLPLGPGDFMMMACPPQWIMQSGPEIEPIGMKTLFADPTALQRCDPAAPAARFLAGHFLFAEPNANHIRSLLSPIVHVRAVDVAAQRLGRLLNLLDDEATADRPGRSLALDRLLEVILVESLRHRATQVEGMRPGLLAGLADPRTSRALRVLHMEPSRAWTVAHLAREAGMSRAGFAARFAEIVGMPPIGYLSDWRMSLAKAALVSGKRPMIEIAEIAGYGSVSAFSTAFSRVTGLSPTAYSQRAAD
ncbi:AraC family transcriptional regulator (plasmid) [Paraburkholderia sp. D15]|uniref:AraC family transcriptional regulator n=1 Tax=Paraburkholderia sp. D15 TaxID=2880218 RepID=UPI0024784145|nr:AraC family transcriptional regulator [Paraburkholderia sp. D15]WGS54946.1 AraC family transcriptional regulator [Paraburkholderia sp. D15]